MVVTKKSNIGETIRQQRRTVSLTLEKLASMSGVSASHLWRVERGERFPSASILHKVAKPLGLQSNELFTLAGYLSPTTLRTDESIPGSNGKQLDPYVARILAAEPVEVQQAAVVILSIMKSLSHGIIPESR